MANEVETKYIYPDGTPFDSRNCCRPDHWETTLVVKVRSQYGLNPDKIKALIEAQHEVTEINVTEKTCVVANPYPGDL